MKRTTTEDPLYYSYSYQFWYDQNNGPSENWMYEYEGIGADDYYSNDLSYLTYASTVKKIDCIASGVAAFLTLLHLFVLSRKELRSNVIFIMMLGIGVCDLTMFVCDSIANFMDWFSKSDDCVTARPYWSEVLRWIIIFSLDVSKACSALIAVLMTAFRTLAVLFPLSDVLQGLMKPVSGALAIGFALIMSLVWKAMFYGRMKIKKVFDCTEKKFDYLLTAPASMDEEFIAMFSWIHGYFSLILGLLYILLSILLVLELRRARLRRKRLTSNNQDKDSDSTSVMVIVMAFSFFVAQAVNIVFVYVEQVALQDWSYLNVAWQEAKDILTVFLTINSSVHCVICFMMSSQYRETVMKRLQCLKWKRSKLVNVEPISVTTVSGAMSTSVH